MSRQQPRLLRVVRVRYRRWLARLDREPPAWFSEVPSWGSSILIHAVVLLLLALYVYTHSGPPPTQAIEGAVNGQLTEDLTSLTDSDHAGDPFTDIKTPEPPSLSIEPAPPDLKVINQPAIPALARFAPDLAGPELSKLPAPGGRALSLQLHSENMTAPFSGRQGVMKAELVRREGGTVHSERAVTVGLDWLVRHQRQDGGWSLNFHEQCRDSGCPPQRCLESETAATGLALLPLLGAGHIHSAKSLYQANVKKGLGWLASHQSANGDLWVGGGAMSHLYSHAIGTMALCEAYGISHDPRLREPCERALKYIILAQDPESGGWRYVPGQYGDTSVFGWQMFALRSGRLAGIRIPTQVIRRCRIYLDLAATDEHQITYSYQPGRPLTPVMTAEALLSRQILGWPRDYPPLVKGASMVAADLEASDDRNIYYWYYATQLLHNMQNDDWKRWNERVREGLIGMQVSGTGCDYGSWDPNLPQRDRWGMSGGRLFVTSLSLLTLEVYYRYLPLYRPTGTDSTDKADAAPPKEKGMAKDKGGS
jgi:hypothetical protein